MLDVRLGITKYSQRNIKLSENMQKRKLVWRLINKQDSIFFQFHLYK